MRRAGLFACLLPLLSAGCLSLAEVLDDPAYDYPLVTRGGVARAYPVSLDDAWVIKSKGVRTDGKVVTVTNQLTQLSKDRFRFDAADRIVGDERLPNVSVISVRRPPSAKKR